MSRDAKSKIWSEKVRKRDIECKRCGAKERLQAHHIIPWKDNDNLRYDISNGLTLCINCHRSIEMKGKPSHMKGKKHSAKTIEKLKKAKIGYTPWNIGIRNIPNSRECKICKIEKEIRNFTPTKYWYSNTCKQCRNLKIRSKRIIKHINRKPTEETRKKLMDAKQGFIPWNKGLKICQNNN